MGRATFYPAGVLRGRLERVLKGRWPNPEHDPIVQRELADLEDHMGPSRWATASAVAIDAAAARENVRDAIALLRIYSRSMSNMNLDHQTFGLTPDIGHSVSSSYVISRGRLVLSSTGLTGIPPSGWTFSHQHADDFSQRPDFSFLDQALRAEPKSDIQKRCTTAIRFLNIASAMLPESVRVVLQATAMEELLADEIRDGRRTRLARRVAFLTCASDRGLRYVDGKRPACLFLASRTRSDLKRAKQAVQARGGDPFCSWYDDVEVLFDTRDRVLHERLEHLPRNAAVNFESQVDEAILAFAAWAETAQATVVDELDSAIDRCAERAYRDWPTPPAITPD